MITGIDINAVSDYTIKKDKKNPTVWKLGALPSDVMAGIATLASINPTGGNIEQMVNLVRLGVRGWTNFQIAGKDVECAIVDEPCFGQTRKMVDKSLTDIIPLDVIVELGTEIIRVNNFTDADQKN